MNRKDAIAQIKKLVFGEERPLLFMGMEYKLADGTPIMIDRLEVGGIAKVGDVIAPDGVHSLEDGHVIEIKDGIIVGVTMKKEEYKDEDEMKNQMAAIKKEFEAFKNDFQTLKGRFEKVSVKAETQQKANEELTKLVEFLAQEPVIQPIQPPVDFEKMTPLERFKFYKQNRN